MNSSKSDQSNTRQYATNDSTLLEALLDSWDRNNTILTNLLSAIPEHALTVRASATSPTIAAQFAHLHYVRLIFVAEDAPECATTVPDNEWPDNFDRDEMLQLLSDSAQTVRQAVVQKLSSGGQMELHYDHPILFLQHMIWHEGYHHGQIKLTLKLTGFPLDDDALGPLTWGVWMTKRKT